MCIYIIMCVYIWSRVPCSHPPHGMGGGMMPLWWCIYIPTYLPTYLRTYIHTITLPYLTLPYITLPYIPSIHTYIPLHYITLPYITLPYLTLPYLTFHTYIHTYQHTNIPPPQATGGGTRRTIPPPQATGGGDQKNHTTTTGHRGGDQKNQTILSTHTHWWGGGRGGGQRCTIYIYIYVELYKSIITCVYALHIQIIDNHLLTLHIIPSSGCSSSWTLGLRTYTLLHVSILPRLF